MPDISDCMELTEIKYFLVCGRDWDYEKSFQICSHAATRVYLVPAKCLNELKTRKTAFYSGCSGTPYFRIFLYKWVRCIPNNFAVLLLLKSQDARAVSIASRSVRFCKS